MELRWLTTEEKRTRTVDSSDLPDVLALAQKLQAEGGGLVREDEVIEMGRELGVRPEFVREALRRRRRTAQPAAPREVSPTPTDHNPLSAAASALVFMFGLLMLPLVARTFFQAGISREWILFAFIAAIVAGWSSRLPRLAGIAGATAVPMILFVASFYPWTMPWRHGLTSEAVFLALFSLCPLCSAAGRSAAGVRRWAEQFIDRPRLAVPDH